MVRDENIDSSVAVALQISGIIPAATVISPVHL